MIVPSIDIVGGRAVQLVGGETLAIEAGDPFPILERFSRVGEVAVIDIDAARGEGSNAPLIEEMASLARVRVGGGIRDVDTALSWLDAGAERIIVGTAASPEFLNALPRERVIVALDARESRVVTHGWRVDAGLDLLEGIRELRDLCGGFLVTFVEKEGRMGGTDMDLARAVVEAAGDTRVTVAGGVTTAEEIDALDRIGADAQVGMALYSGTLDLADAFAAPLASDRPDGLWPTVVVDEGGAALGLAWSSRESLRQAIDTGRGVYQSRSRGLWVKGETSGASQELLMVSADCDRDSLRFVVRQHGTGFCHLHTRTCWGEDTGIGRLARRLADIVADPPPGSHTARLAGDPDLLAAKLIEEAGELAAATDPDDVAGEAADLIYFALAKAAASGVRLADIEAVLDRRAKRVRRRPMERKDTP